MFLNVLKEDNKKRFLKLCVHAAVSDGVFADDEKEMVKAYCREMDLAEDIPEAEETLDSILKELAENTTATEKRIVVLEILGLVKSDGIYDEKEKVFMEKILRSLGIDGETSDQLESLLDKYTAVFKELYAVVFE